jgi:hypothetical protein
MAATTSKNPKIKKRNELIRKKYNELTEKKHLNSDYALGILEDMFITLEKTTLWLIISQTGHYKNY